MNLEQQKQGPEIVEDKHQCKKRKVAPPSQITSFFLVKEIFPYMVSKIMDNNVFLALADCITCIASFDLWMFHANYYIFAMVINFTNDFIRQHVNIIVGWFEVWNTLGV